MRAASSRVKKLEDGKQDVKVVLYYKNNDLYFCESEKYMSMDEVVEAYPNHKIISIEFAEKF